VGGITGLTKSWSGSYKKRDREGAFSRGVASAIEASDIRRTNWQWAQGLHGNARRFWKISKRRIQYSRAKRFRFESKTLEGNKGRYTAFNIIDSRTGRIIKRNIDFLKYRAEHVHSEPDKVIRVFSKTKVESNEETKQRVWASLEKNAASDIAELTPEETARLAVSIRGAKSRTYVPTVPLGCPFCLAAKAATISAGEMIVDCSQCGRKAYAEDALRVAGTMR
jgi:hypothetical protein